VGSRCNLLPPRTYLPQVFLPDLNDLDHLRSRILPTTNVARPARKDRLVPAGKILEAQLHQLQMKDAANYGGLYRLLTITPGPKRLR
jgi:hypothetical protein